MVRVVVLAISIVLVILMVDCHQAVQRQGAERTFADHEQWLTTELVMCFFMYQMPISVFLGSNWGCSRVTLSQWSQSFG